LGDVWCELAQFRAEVARAVHDVPEVLGRWRKVEDELGRQGAFINPAEQIQQFEPFRV